MYWGRNLEQILFFVEGTGSWPFPSKVPVELPSPPFPASRGLHDDHFQQGWCKTSLLSSHPSSPSCLPGGFLELCRWNCTGWVSTSVYKWHSVWGFFVFVWLVWGFFGGGILLFFFFFICFGLFQTGAVPLSQLLSPCVCSCSWAGESWQARQEWVGVRGGGQDLFTLGSAPAKITAWNCTLSRQFDYWGTAPSTWFIHVAQNR